MSVLLWQQSSGTPSDTAAFRQKLPLGLLRAGHREIGGWTGK